MATKTISIEIDVYERLKALKSTSSESFSQVLRRELPRQRGLPVSELLKRAENGAFLNMNEEGLANVEWVRTAMNRWDDPWTR
jgi:predicted CopG family antitoxin